MIGPITGLLRSWLTQEQARTNAAQASVRLQHRRRQLEDVDAFLAAQHHRPSGSRDRVGAPATVVPHPAHPRQRPH